MVLANLEILAFVPISHENSREIEQDTVAAGSILSLLYAGIRLESTRHVLCLASHLATERIHSRAARCPGSARIFDPKARRRVNRWVREVTVGVHSKTPLRCRRPPE